MLGSVTPKMTTATHPQLPLPLPPQTITPGLGPSTVDQLQKLPAAANLPANLPHHNRERGGLLL
jgi:hypothetical protein